MVKLCKLFFERLSEVLGYLNPVGDIEIVVSDLEVYERDIDISYRNSELDSELQVSGFSRRLSDYGRLSHLSPLRLGYKRFAWNFEA